MAHSRKPLSAEIWMRNIFTSQSAASGGVVRRQTADVERIIGKQNFVDEVERRGFRALENNGQIIVICNSDPIRMLV